MTTTAATRASSSSRKCSSTRPGRCSPSARSRTRAATRPTTSRQQTRSTRMLPSASPRASTLRRIRSGSTSTCRTRPPATTRRSSSDSATQRSSTPTTSSRRTTTRAVTRSAGRCTAGSTGMVGFCCTRWSPRCRRRSATRRTGCGISTRRHLSRLHRHRPCSLHPSHHRRHLHRRRHHPPRHHHAPHLCPLHHQYSFVKPHRDLHLRICRLCQFLRRHSSQRPIVRRHRRRRRSNPQWC